MATRLATWVRVSGDNQKDAFGIPAQRSAIQWTLEHGRDVPRDAQIIKRFEVIDVSGKDIMLAHETHELIRLMQAKQIDGVITHDLTRICRPDDLSAWQLLAEFQKTRTTLFTPEKTYDLKTPEDILMATVQGGIGGYQRNVIKRNTMRGRQEARLAARRLCARLPIGVDYQEGRGWNGYGWLYTPESKRVREAYLAIVSGETLIRAAQILGLKSGTAARYVIQNAIYKGWFVSAFEVCEAPAGPDGRQPKYQRRTRREQPVEVRVMPESLALVSEREWLQANALLAAKRETKRRDHTSHRATYNGFLFCDLCGRVMTPTEGSRGAYFYACIGRMRAKRSGCERCSCPYVKLQRLEASVDTVMGRVLTDRAFCERLAMQLENAHNRQSRASKLERLESDLATVEAKRSRILDQFDEGLYTKAQRDAKLATVAERFSQLSSDVKRARESVVPAIPARQLEAMFQVFKEWDCLKPDARRRLLAAHVPALRVRDGQVVSVYRLLEGQAVRSPVPTQQTAAQRAKTGRKPVTLASSAAATLPGVWIDLAA